MQSFLTSTISSRKQRPTTTTIIKEDDPLFIDFEAAHSGMAADSPDNGDDEDDRPYFFLHVGLPKTGTTNLQCSLCSDPNRTEPILLSDNLIFMGTCPTADCQLPNGRPKQFLSHTHDSFFLDGRHVTQLQVQAKLKEQYRNNETIADMEEEEDGTNDSSFVFPEGLPGPILHKPEMAHAHYKLSSKNIPKLAPDFMYQTEVIRASKRNALVVFEGCHVYSARHIRALAAFLKPNWKVHVLVAYRPLHEWLISKHNSINKYSRNPQVKQWPGLPVHGYPGKVGIPLPQYDMPQANNVSHLDLMGALTHVIESVYHMHPAEIVQRNYQLNFPNVHVVPLHKARDLPSFGGKEQMDLLEVWFCHVLVQQTPEICESIQSGRFYQSPNDSQETVPSAMVYNPSFPLNYDLLAVAAYEKGLIPIRHPNDYAKPSRKHIAKALAKRHEEAKQSFQENPSAFPGIANVEDMMPVKCLPNATLERLEKLSWELEHQLFPPTKVSPSWTAALAFALEDGTSGVVDANDPDYQRHKAGFQETLSKKLCHVDTDKALKIEPWKSFFDDLIKDQHDAEDDAEEDKDTDPVLGHEFNDEEFQSNYEKKLNQARERLAARKKKEILAALLNSSDPGEPEMAVGDDFVTGDDDRTMEV